MKSLTDYTIVMRPDDNGTFVAYVPAIAAGHAWGQTPDYASAELVNVFDMIREEYEEEGRKLPQDVDLAIARLGEETRARSRLSLSSHSHSADTANS